MSKQIHNVAKESGAIPLRYRLSFRLPAQVSALTLVILTLLSVIIFLSVAAMLRADMERTVDYAARHNASLAADYLNAMQTRAEAVAASMSQLERGGLGRADKEALILGIMETMMEDARIFSTYTAWEPNGMLEQSPKGQSYYYYRDGSSIRLDKLNDYDVYREGDYYFAARDSGKPYISEPYPYTLTTGQEVWLITISNPIKSASGTFLGVSNCDILLDTLGGLDYDRGGYENSYQYILSSEGTYLANSLDSSLLGTSLLDNFQGAQQSEAEGILSALKSGSERRVNSHHPKTGQASYITQVPLRVNGVDTPLASTFVVEEREMFSEVYVLMGIIAGVSALGLLALVLTMSTLLRRAFRPMDDIMTMARNMRDGNLSAALTVRSRDEFGRLAATFGETCAVLQRYIEEISSCLTTIARKDLRVVIHQDYVGDFAPIKDALHQITDSLNETLSLIDSAAEQVNLGSEQVSSGAQALAAGSTEQAAAVEELNASVAEVADRAVSNLESIRRAADAVRQMSAEAQDGNQSMGRLGAAMEDISRASAQISDITKVIEDIAFQTNILALNAAIEAARGGSAGKGFAVVADEVRNLAAKSTEAAQQTAGLISGAAASVARGAQLSAHTADVLSRTEARARSVMEGITSVETASSEQTHSIEQIREGLSQVSAVVQTNAATAEENSATSEEMSAQATTLRAEIHQFRLKA